jgi:hypothetical protein
VIKKSVREFGDCETPTVDGNKGFRAEHSNKKNFVLEEK